jgi:hypothetical protein
MRTTRMVFAAALLLAVVGCGGKDDGGSVASTTTSTSTSSTSIPATTTTAPATTGIGIPNHLRYGPDRLERVAGADVTTLVDGPVTWAADDRAGGVVYADDQHGWWLAAGASGPVRADFGGVPAVVDGRPSLISTLAYPCQTDVAVYDLATGTIDAPPCDEGEGGDSWVQVTSTGGDWYTTVYGTDVNNASTDAMVRIVGPNGEESDPGNPYGDPDACLVPGEGGAGACDVDAVLSSDGLLLATWYRPDFVVVWPALSEGGFDHDAWVARLDTVGALVRVTERGTGAERYRTQLPARTRLADFDGRFLVVVPTTLGTTGWEDADEAWSIVDVTGRQPPIEVDGPVALLHSAPGVGGTIDVRPPTLHRGDTGPWVSYLQQQLRSRGATLDVDGIFGAGTDTAVRQVQTSAGIEVDGIVGPDTWTALGLPTPSASEPDEVLAILRSDGIASIDFGTPAGEAIERLTAVLGPPTDDATSSNAYDCEPPIQLRTLRWSDPAGTTELTVVFSNWDDQTGTATGAMRMRWWGTGWGRFTTAEGVGPATTVSRLRALDPTLELGAGGEPFGQAFVSVDLASGTFSNVVLDWTIGPPMPDLQAALNAHGANLVVGDSWGPRTAQALTAFAADHGISGAVADWTGPILAEPLYDTIELLGLPPDDVTVIFLSAGETDQCRCLEGEC